MQSEGTILKKYRAGIYARLSVDSHSSKNESIDTQIEIARVYAAGEPDIEIFDCYADLGCSGMEFGRAEFQRLMKDIREKRINCVIVKDFSRLGRDYLETGDYIEKIFPGLSVRFISISDRFDSTKDIEEDDKICMNLKNLINELYARDIGKRVRLAKEIRKQQGSYIGPQAPYGFRIVIEDKKRLLSAKPEAAAVLTELFLSYGAGKSIRSIIEYLFERQVHPPRQYRMFGHVYREGEEQLQRWTPGTVRSILSNPVYGGSAAGEALVDTTVMEQIKRRDAWRKGKDLSQKAVKNSRSKTSSGADTADVEKECGGSLKKNKRQNQNDLIELYGRFCNGMLTGVEFEQIIKQRRKSEEPLYPVCEKVIR